MSSLERQRNTSGSEAAVASQAEIGQASSNADLRGASYEEGAAMLKPGADPAADKAARLKRARESWERLFGETIGAELFALVSKHLSASELTGYAHSAVEALAGATEGLVKPGDSGMSKDEAEATNKLLAALSKDVAKLEHIERSHRDTR